MRSFRLPSPGSHPTIVNSSRCLFLSFSQPRERRPGSYGQSSRLATIPSRPCYALAASSTWPSPVTYSGVCQCGPLSSSSTSRARRSS